MLDVPHEVVEYVSWLICAGRRELRSRWRRLSCFRQAALVLVHLRKNETLQQVGVGFGVSTATVGRYVTEAVDVLADHAPTLLDALHHHDLTRQILVLADRAYRGAGATVRTPYGRDPPEKCARFNRDHARLRAPGERALARPEQWWIFRKARCSPNRISRTVAAVHTIETAWRSG